MTEWKGAACGRCGEDVWVVGEVLVGALHVVLAVSGGVYDPLKDPLQHTAPHTGRGVICKGTEAVYTFDHKNVQSTETEIFLDL